MDYSKKNAGGKLYNRLHNIQTKKRSVQSLVGIQSNKKAKPTEVPRSSKYEHTTEEIDHYNNLKHDSLTMTAKEKLEAWNGCFNIRMHDLEHNVSDFDNKWPDYCEPSGHIYVSLSDVMCL